MSLAEFVKKRRKKLGITTYEVYKRGFSHSHLLAIEKGRSKKPMPETLKSLSTAIKTPYPVLLKETGYISSAQAKMLIEFDQLNEDEKEKALAFLKRRNF